MIRLSLPPEIEQQLRAKFPDLERHILEDYLAQAYLRDELTSYEVGRILGFEDREQTIQFLSACGVFPNYDVEDLEEDRATHLKVFSEKNQQD